MIGKRIDDGKCLLCLRNLNPSLQVLSTSISGSAGEYNPTYACAPYNFVGCIVEGGYVTVESILREVQGVTQSIENQNCEYGKYQPQQEVQELQVIETEKSQYAILFITSSFNDQKKII